MREGCVRSFPVSPWYHGSVFPRWCIVCARSRGWQVRPVNRRVSAGVHKQHSTSGYDQPTIPVRVIHVDICCHQDGKSFARTLGPIRLVQGSCECRVGRYELHWSGGRTRGMAMASVCCRLQTDSVATYVCGQWSLCLSVLWHSVRAFGPDPTQGASRLDGRYQRRAHRETVPIPASSGEHNQRSRNLPQGFSPLCTRPHSHTQLWIRWRFWGQPAGEHPLLEGEAEKKGDGRLAASEVWISFGDDLMILGILTAVRPHCWFRGTTSANGEGRNLSFLRALCDISSMSFADPTLKL